MNILPLILALVLMLTVMTVEKIEKYKNQAIVQKQYQSFLEMGERQVFNKRQEVLYGLHDKDIKQLSFRFIVFKDAREANEAVAKQLRLLNMELMKILYGEATFFKELLLKRPAALDELITAIEKAADEAPDDLINQIEDIARLDLGDPELQDAFYHMLKGTVTRKQYKEVMKDPSSPLRGNSYVSLFAYINYKGAQKRKKTSSVPQIEIQHSPREILKAVFESDEVAEAIMARRKELWKSKDNGASAAFENEFKGKIRSGIDDILLNFKITKKGTGNYD